MRLMEHDCPPGLAPARAGEATPAFSALVVADATDAAGDIAASVAAAGGRLLAMLGWHEAIDRIVATGVRATLALDARGVGEDRVATLLSRIDGLAAGRDMPVIVAIGESQIDLAAAGLALSRHQILCEPHPSDWVVALTLSGAATGLALHDHGVADSESARLAKLNAEVARITNVLARLSKREEQHQIRAVEERAAGFVAQPGEEPPAVTAAAVRQIVRARRLRDRHLGEGLFEDPAWDMILDLYAAHLERAQVSVSSLCIAASVAPTTALRWIARLSDAGIFERRPDPFDRRRAFMSLSETGLAGMHRYVTTVRAMGLPLV